MPCRCCKRQLPTWRASRGAALGTAFRRTASTPPTTGRAPPVPRQAGLTHRQRLARRAARRPVLHHQRHTGRQRPHTTATSVTKGRRARALPPPHSPSTWAAARATWATPRWPATPRCMAFANRISRRPPTLTLFCSKTWSLTRTRRRPSSPPRSALRRRRGARRTTLSSARGGRATDSWCSTALCSRASFAASSRAPTAMNIYLLR
mmetsp:Transcript_7268/g.30910  ORF Transcript_7268/g.30910 Transcript_7268/m.30910 type:complete len:207 (-) Transcript_7268:8-628(-)